MSVCICSKGCLHRYLNSLIHQSCAVWTSQPRGRDTNWRIEANQRCAHAHPTFSHVERSRTTFWFGCMWLWLCWYQRPSGETSPALSCSSCCSISGLRLTFTCCWKVFLLCICSQDSLVESLLLRRENLYYSTPFCSEQTQRPTQENNGFLERVQMENEQRC